MVRTHKGDEIWASFSARHDLGVASCFYILDRFCSFKSVCVALNKAMQHRDVIICFFWMVMGVTTRKGMSDSALDQAQNLDVAVVKRVCLRCEC